MYHYNLKDLTLNVNYPLHEDLTILKKNFSQNMYIFLQHMVFRKILISKI